MKVRNLLKENHIIILIIWLSIFSVNKIYPQITVTTTDVSCHGCTDGSAKVSVEGGTPPYEYIWNDGGGPPVKNGLAPGYYVVVIADKNGCTGSAGFNIYDKPEPPEPFTITIVRPKDPNDISGPAGYGDPRWVSVNDQLNYVIRFENDPKEATAPVQKVVITHPIDDMANMFSFQLGDFSFRHFNFQVPPNTSHYFKRMNLADSIGVILDVTAGLDVTKKEAFWIFQSFDPETGLPNIDPYVGFLLVNDSITHNGEGSVSFSIKPKRSSNTGDTIKANASIVFDINEPLPTNTVFNVIDARPPVSRIKSINRISSDIAEISWTGSDDPNGSGVAGYKLLVSSGKEPYTSYANVKDTSFTVSLAGGNEFKIQSIGKDNTNNIEMVKPLPDTVLFITPQVVLGNDMNICLNDSIILNAGSGFDSYLWNDGSTNRTLTVNAPGIYFVTAKNDTITSSDTIMIGYYEDPVPSLHNNNPGLCAGGSLILDAGEGYSTYTWNTGELGQNIEITEAGRYTVVVFDQHGCRGTDSLTVTLHEKPEISLGNDTTIMSSDTLILIPRPGNFASYLWNDGSTADSLVIIGIVAGAGLHSYWLEVTDLNNCSASDTVSILVSVPINIEDESINGITLSVSPNPVINILNLSVEGVEYGNVMLEMVNMEGVRILLRQYKITGTVLTDELDMSKLPPGPYIIRVTTKGTELLRKVIKQ